MDWATGRARFGAPMLAPLAPWLAAIDGNDWPTRDALNALAAGIVTSGGRPVRFVPPPNARDDTVPYYERRIAESGEIETRPGNWHDLFNALAWCAFPKAKAVVNAQHAAILAEGGEAEARRRSPARDALSLFDEGGVAVASSDPAVFGRIRDFEWKALFWRERVALARSTVFVPFGHALSEKALEPFAGIVAKTVFLPVAPGFAALEAEERVARVDAMLSSHFADRARFATPRLMAPLPVTGVPGWHPRTADEDWYDDRTHFQPKPAGRGTPAL